MPVNQRQQKAIQCLLTSSTRRQAAERAGIAESTLRSYFQSDEFVSAYRQAASDALQDATRRAQAATGEAVSTLEAIMRNEDESAQARISASRSVLEYAMKMGEQLDLAQRMDEIEKAIAEGGGST